jgi:hypothetical protein
MLACDDGTRRARPQLRDLGRLGAPANLSILM